MADETETLTETPDEMAGTDINIPATEDGTGEAAIEAAGTLDAPAASLDLDELAAAPSVPAVGTGGASSPNGDNAEADETGPNAEEIEAVYDVPVQVQAVLGKTTMQVSQLLKLGRGAVVELDRKVGEAIDIYVNNRLVARGEVVVVEDRLGVTMTEIIKSDAA